MSSKEATMGTFVYVCPRCGEKSGFGESRKVCGTAFMPTEISHRWHDCGKLSRAIHVVAGFSNPFDDKRFLGGIFSR